MASRLFSTHLLLPIIILFHLPLGAWADCYTPGVDACHDGSRNTSCSSPTNGRYTYNDGSLIGVPTNESLLSTAKYVSCYCQQAQGFQTPIDNNVVVTKCFGQLLYVGNEYNTDPPEEEGYANWFDAVQMMASGFDPINDETNYMDCRGGLSPGSDTTPSESGSLVYITWIQPTPDIEAPLPSTAASDASGLCPGYDVEAGFNPNPYDAAHTYTIAANDAVNCTCQTQVLALIDDNGDSDPINGNTFATICSSDYSVYWNGQGYRKARRAVQSGNDDISDDCTAPTDSASSIAYVLAKSTNSDQNDNGGKTDSASAIYLRGCLTSKAMLAFSAMLLCLGFSLMI